ncbi:MAG: apolipoprotein N-acyltransferase [Hyphomicrobiaceae bacterium]
MPAPTLERGRTPGLNGGWIKPVGQVADTLKQLAGWKRWLAAVTAGALSTLAMPPFFLWPILFVTLPALVWLIEGARSDAHRDELESAAALDWKPPARAALAGWLFGFGFHVAGLYWLREAFLVTGGNLALLWPLGVIGLPAYLALFHAAAAAAAAAVPGSTARRVLALGLALAVTEWLRGHVLTGFPWNVLGISLTWPLPLMQSVSVFGIYGLTLIAVIVFAMPAALLAMPDRGAGGSAAAVMVAAAPLCLLALFGAYRLSIPVPPNVAGVHLRLVQPNIPQRAKWQQERQREFLDAHIALTRVGLTDTAAATSGVVWRSWPGDPKGSAVAADVRPRERPTITHVIWPEAAMPFVPLRYPEVLADLGKMLPRGAQLLAGILRTEGRWPNDDFRAFNSLAIFNDDGQNTAVYDKIHLVPFGEYLPFQAVLESIGLKALTRQRGGFAPGPSPRPLVKIAGLPPASVLICYEAVFPGAVVQGPQRPGVLINVTNDGWFGNSTGPRQHLHQARLRTVEEGLPLLRVANNGISAVFDAYGRELARLDLDVAGIIDTRLPGAIPPPIYARLGDLTFVILWIAGAIGLFMMRRRAG